MILRSHWLCLTLLAPLATADARTGLFFVPNRGQVHTDIRYMVKGPRLTAYFKQAEIVFRAGEITIGFHLLGANPAAPVESKDRIAGKANFFVGNDPDQWHTDIPVYAEVVYRDIYPGVDMVYGGSDRRLKSEFIVAPGADPSVIRFEYIGVEHLEIDDSGALLLQTSGGALREEAPEAYQQAGADRQRVESRFITFSDGSIGFMLGVYDRTRALIIDPPISYASYFGGAGMDSITAIAADNSGSVYTAGWTESGDLRTKSPAQARQYGIDAFAAKFSADGQMVYCTYLGGNREDRAYGIAVDDAGNAYVAGATMSTDFPTVNAYRRSLAGARNAFVAKLNSSGNALVYSTYFGGRAYDNANGIAVDSSGSAYITGDTTSPDLPLQSPYQTMARGGSDAFVARLLPAGNALAYSTYLGGRADDRGRAIAVDAGGSAYITGDTYSPDFPALGALQGMSGGSQDAFVAKLAPGGGLSYSTYLGGAGGTIGLPETGAAIAVDAAGNAYVAGTTSSYNFPLSNALQTARAGSQSDAFVAKINSSGASLIYSTYIGGSSVDVATAIRVDSEGQVYAAGYTASDDFPATAAGESRNRGGYDGFLVQLSAGGGQLRQSMCLGGSSNDAINALALGPSYVYVAGQTLSGDFPVNYALQSIPTGTMEAFIAKLATGTQVQPQLHSITPNTAAAGSASITLTANGSGFTSGATILWTAGSTTTLTTAFLSATQLQATVPASLLSAAGSAQVAVLSGNVLTGAQTFSITAPVAQLNSISPNTAAAGSAPLILTATGSGFVSGAAIQWTAGSTTTLTTTFVDATKLQATVPASLLAVAGTAQVAVSSGASTTTSLPFVISSAGVGVMPVSASPNSGSGMSQVFQFRYADSLGVGDLRAVWAYFTPAFNTNSANTCLFYYDRAENRLYLVNDAATAWISGVVGAGGSLQNSQCRVDLAATVIPSGNELALSVPVTFAAAFAGTKQIWMYAAGGSSSSGWQRFGDWTVTAPPQLQLSSISPNTVPAGSGPITLTVTGLGFVNGATVQWTAASTTVLPTTFLSATQLRATVPANLLGAAGTVQVAVSSGSGTTTPLPLVITATAPAVTALSATPSTGVGSRQTFQFAYSDTLGAADLRTVWAYFTPVFNPNSAHTCIFYYDRGSNRLNLVNDSATTWISGTVGSAGVLQNSQCSLSLSSTTAVLAGNNLTLSAAVTFSAAFNGLKQVWGYAAGITMNSGWQQLGVWTVTAAVAELISITPNTAPAGSGPLVVTVNGSGFATGDLVQFTSPGSGSTTSLLTVFINPNQLQATIPANLLASGGAAQVRVLSPNNSTASLPFTITFSAGAAAISVTPTSGAGLSQTFQFEYSDSLGGADLRSVWAYFTPAFNTNSSNTCIFYYEQASNRLYLANNAATAWISGAIGSIGNLQNSQCSVNLASAFARTAADSLSLSVPVTFTPAFAGAKQVWIYAAGSQANSGWQRVGDWTIN